jgi:hypothetical protein
MSEMTEISDLAANYARQLANVDDLRRTVELAKVNFLREDAALEDLAGELKVLVGANRPRLLVPIGFGRHVLVHSTNGSYGRYASIDIIEETK